MTNSRGFGVQMLEKLQAHNPFYIISAACMLGGCLAITNSLSWVSIPIGRLIALIAALNVYETAVIALAIFLIKHRGIIRDGVMLLVLEAFFLADATFLNAEMATSHPTLGIWLNVVLFLAAIIKLAIVGRALGMRVESGIFGAMVVQLAALFALPIWFRWIDHGQLPAVLFYGAWWGTGLLIPISMALTKLSPATNSSGWSGRTLAVYVSLPWLSIVLHLGILHYVYDVPFYGADAAPLLLGLAILLSRSVLPTNPYRNGAQMLQFILPLAAMFVSDNNPSPLCFGLDHFKAIWITPERLAIAGAYLTYVYCFALAYAPLFLAAGALALMGMIWGPSRQQIQTRAGRATDSIGQFFMQLIPQTATAWGMSAIAAAFVFLGFGAFLSLRPRRIPPIEPEPILDLGDPEQ